MTTWWPTGNRPVGAGGAASPSHPAGRAPSRRVPESAPVAAKPQDGQAQEAIDLVLQTAAGIYAERGDRTKLWGSMIKQTLKRRRPGFNESFYGVQLVQRPARGGADPRSTRVGAGRAVRRVPGRARDGGRTVRGEGLSVSGFRGASAAGFGSAAPVCSRHAEPVHKGLEPTSAHLEAHAVREHRFAVAAWERFDLAAGVQVDDRGA